VPVPVCLFGVNGIRIRYTHLVLYMCAAMDLFHCYFLVLEASQGSAILGFFVCWICMRVFIG
jgi:hypothetical protein